jgi:hypothetical protein
MDHVAILLSNFSLSFQKGLRLHAKYYSLEQSDSILSKERKIITWADWPGLRIALSFTHSVEAPSTLLHQLALSAELQASIRVARLLPSAKTLAQPNDLLEHSRKI